MAQFDVHAIDGHGLVVDCQSDLFSDLKSHVVAPLRDPSEAVAHPRMNPSFVIEDREYRMATQFLRAVESRQLGPVIVSLAEREWDIKAALDMLISGV